MSNPPVFARDYVFSAQLTNLAYSSSHLETGMTGDRLAAAIRENGNPFASEAELTAFARDYEVVLSSSSIAGDTSGANFVAFHKLGTGVISFAIAGIGSEAEAESTFSRTMMSGFNDLQYASVRNAIEILWETFPNAQFDLSGHSLGGQLIQVLTADFFLHGREDQLLSAVTFGTYGVNLSAAGNFVFGSSLVPDFRQLLNELGRRLISTHPQPH